MITLPVTVDKYDYCSPCKQSYGTPYFFAEWRYKLYLESVKCLGFDYSNLIGCDPCDNFNSLGTERNISAINEKKKI